MESRREGMQLKEIASWTARFKLNPGPKRPRQQAVVPFPSFLANPLVVGDMAQWQLSLAKSGKESRGETARLDFCPRSPANHRQLHSRTERAAIMFQTASRPLTAYAIDSRPGRGGLCARTGVPGQCWCGRHSSNWWEAALRSSEGRTEQTCPGA